MAWDLDALVLAILLLAVPLTGCLGGLESAGEEASQPAEDVNIRRVHTFTGTEEEAVRQDVEIPADSGPYSLQMRIEPPDGSGACAAQEAQVALLDPNGTEFAEASTTLSATPNSESCGATTERTSVELEPGTWTVRFTGNGSAQGVLVIQN